MLLKLNQILCGLKLHRAVQKERAEFRGEENSHDGDFLRNGEIIVFFTPLIIYGLTPDQG